MGKLGNDHGRKNEGEGIYSDVCLYNHCPCKLVVGYLVLPVVSYKFRKRLLTSEFIMT